MENKIQQPPKNEAKNFGQPQRIPLDGDVARALGAKNGVKTDENGRHFVRPEPAPQANQG